MRGAQLVGLGDSPWVALLIFSIWDDNGSEQRVRCSGSVFGDQWILTAAHCVEGAFNIEIYFGYNFSKQNPSTEHKYNGASVFIHPKFKAIPTAPKGYDIALVKLSEPIDTIGKQFVVNNICLPERWSGTDCYFKPTPNCQPREYGMATGWGSGKYPGPNYLQIGYWRLWNERYDLSTDINHENRVSKMSLDRLANQSLCSGDSGGPVWQYHLGRAVIVGVLSTTWFDNMWCNTSPAPGPDDVPQSTAVWVDQEIEWIKNVIKNATTNKP